MIYAFLFFFRANTSSGSHCRLLTTSGLSQVAGDRVTGVAAPISRRKSWESLSLDRSRSVAGKYKCDATRGDKHARDVELPLIA